MLTPELTLVGVLRSEKREFLVASNNYLKGYRLCVGARDYGKQLMVYWYLIAEPVSLIYLIREWIRYHQKISLGVFLVGLILSFITKGIYPIFILWLPFLGYVTFACLTSKRSVLPQMMNIFDLEELTAYVTTVHHAVLDAAKEISESVGFDFSKVDQKSRGFLNIS
jgi:membrane-associated protease RseP (regulator of RpoE activity)